VSQVLDGFPQIELDSVTWSVDRPGAGPAKPAGGGPVTPKPAPSAVEEVLAISGRVPAMRRSDYRAITAEVQRFADALGADPNYRVQRTQLPFDVTSEGILSGDIGSASEGGDAPRFTIFLARSLP
jgi:hypothetical protein